jgi:hypothetical protein
MVLMILPPHSSHLTQPLDVGLFGPLKKLLASKLEPLIRTGISRIHKPEFTRGFIQAHQDAFKESNVLSGFSGTGIHPFHCSKVLRQVQKSPSVQRATPPIATPSVNPFNANVLTSSPANMEDVRAANTEFRRLLDCGESISNDAKQYFDCLTRTSERNWTRKIILAKQNEDLNAVVGARRTRLSGKRRVIMDDSLITTVEKLEGIRAAEKKTKESRAKRPKVDKQSVSKGRGRSVRQPSTSSDSSSEMEVEVLDCIEVQ